MRNLAPSGFALWFVSCITVALLDRSHLPTFFCHSHALLHPISPRFPWLFRSVSLHWSFSTPCPVISRPISFTSAFIRLLHRSSFIHAEKLRCEALRAHPTSNSSTSQPRPGFCDGSPSSTLKSWGGRIGDQFEEWKKPRSGQNQNQSSEVEPAQRMGSFGWPATPKERGTTSTLPRPGHQNQRSEYHWRSFSDPARRTNSLLLLKVEGGRIEEILFLIDRKAGHFDEDAKDGRSREGTFSSKRKFQPSAKISLCEHLNFSQSWLLVLAGSC